MSRNRDSLTRAFKIVKLFERRNVTIKELADELEISKQMAGRWIIAASIALPLTEVGKQDSVSGKGAKAIIYGLMER